MTVASRLRLAVLAVALVTAACRDSTGVDPVPLPTGRYDLVRVDDAVPPVALPGVDGKVWVITGGGLDFRRAFGSVGTLAYDLEEAPADAPLPTQGFYNWVGSYFTPSDIESGWTFATVGVGAPGARDTVERQANGTLLVRTRLRMEESLPAVPLRLLFTPVPD